MPEDVPWLSLDPDESIVWSGTPRLFLVVHVAVLALALPVVAVAAVRTWWSAVGGLALWAAVVAGGYLYVSNLEYVVSTEYLYAKRGILSRSVTQVALRNVQNTTVRQGVFGVYFDHGTVAFSTAGSDGEQLRFLGIRSPLAAKAHVDEHLPRGRSGRSSGTAASGDVGTASSDVGAASGVVGQGSDAGAGSDGVDAVLSEARSMRAAAERLEAAVAERARTDGGRSTDDASGGDRP